MKKYFKLILVLFSINSITLFAKGLENNLILGGSVGYSYQDVSQDNKNGVVSLNEKLERNGVNFNLQIGYSFIEDIDLALNYQALNYDDVHMDNIYISIKYMFEKKNKYTPYIGSNLGYSRLSWDKNPVNTPNNDRDSSKLLLGVVTGFLYSITANLDMDLYYQLNYHDHDTYIESFPASATLNHKISHGLNLGFRYSF